MRRIFLSSIFLAVLFVSVSGLYAADPSSSNYQLGDSYFPAASGSGASAAYQVAESTIDYFSKSAASSANYSVESKVGISGLEKIPVIQSVTPGDYSRFYTDENASFEVTASTPDSDTLQYRAKEDNVTKVAAQNSNTLAWALGGADQGRRSMSMEVIDPDGTVSKTQASYIYRRPLK